MRTGQRSIALGRLMPAKRRITKKVQLMPILPFEVCAAPRAERNQHPRLKQYLRLALNVERAFVSLIDEARCQREGGRCFRVQARRLRENVHAAFKAVLKAISHR